MSTSPWDLTPVASQLGPQGRDDKATMKKAAAGFEAILMRQWLQEVRKSSLFEEGGTSAGYLEMADDQMAAMLSRNGGLGLARQLSAQLLKQVEAAQLSARPEIAVITGTLGDKK
jgi:Rod binding domain-containing protein